MSDYMKEAERLIEEYGNAEWRVGKMSEHSDDAEEIVTRENARAALLTHIQREAVPEGWKEATIAWEVCASIHREYAKKKDPFFTTRQADFVKHTEAARAALLAHIERGVPEGNERDEWEAVVFTLMGHAASLYFLGQSDMPNWFYELAEKLARRHVDEALAARVREVGIQQRAALAAAPDQFRDATKMMAEPAEVPMPEPDYRGPAEAGDYFSGYTHTTMCAYGDAREAAGYARVLEWAVSRWKDEVENRPLENKNRRPLDDVWRQVVRFAGGDPDALLGPSHDAAMRGEVKP